MALSASELAIIIKAQDQASNVFRQVQQSAGGMSSSLSRVAESAVGFATGTLAVQGFGMALNGIKTAAVSFNSQLEQTGIAWKTFTGSAEGAQAVIQQVQQIAASTPFEFEDVNRAALRFVNAGMSAQQALNFITPLSNAIAAVGGNSATVDQVSRAISQIGAKGKVSAEEINQLAEAGINGWNVLAQAIGKPIPVIQQMAQQGEISARQFNDAFSQFFGAGSKFADAATEQAKSFQGSLSTISDQLKFVGATAFKPLFDAISQLAQRIAAFVQSDQFTVWGGRMQAVVGLVLDGLGYLGHAFENALSSVFSTVSTVGQSIYQALQWINPFARHSPSLVEQVEGGVSAIEESYSRLGSASGAFDNVRASFEQLTQTTEAFTQQFGEDLPTKTEKALAIMGPGARAAFDSTRDAMDAAKGSLQDINDQWQAQTAALTPLKTALDDAKDSLQSQQRALGDLRGKLEDAKAAYEPLKEELKGYEQAAKDAEGAIKDLSDAQLQGSAEMQQRIGQANVALKEQELSFSRLKQSDAYKSIGQQIDAAQDKIRQLQNTEAKSTSAREEQRKAIQAQRDLIDQLKDKQEGMLAPAQRELDSRRDSLDAIRLERDATVGLAEDRVKAAATAALGGKEMTEQQVMEGIAAAKAARDKALGQADTLKPQVGNQERNIAQLEEQIRSQEHTVASAQAAVDKASASYDEQKKSVDALAQSYRDGKAELSNYEQQVRQLVQTADLQIQKAKEQEEAQKRAAAEAKKAAKLAAQAGQGSAGNSDVAGGLDLDTAKKKAQAFADEVQRTRDRVTGALAPVNTAFATVSNAVAPMLDAFRQISPQVQTFALVAGGLVLAAVNLAPLFIGLGVALAGLVSPVALLVVGLAALGAAVVTNLGGIRDTILVPLTGAAQNMLVALAPLGGAFDMLASRVQAAFAQLVAGDLPGALGTVLSALMNFRSQLVEIVGTWAGAFLDWVLPLIPQLVGQLLTISGAVLTWIEEQAGNYLVKLLGWGEAFVSWLEPRLPAILAMLSSVGLQIISWIGAQGTVFIAKLGTWAKAFEEWVIPMLPRLTNMLKTIGDAILNFVITAVPIIAGSLGTWIQTFLGWVVPLIPPLLGALAQMLGDLISWVVEEAVPKIATALGDWAAAFIDWVGPQIDPLLTETVKLLDALAAWIIATAPEIAKKLAQWGSAFIDWVSAEVLPRISTALGYIMDGGSGWEGLKKWIPNQVVALAAALGTWAGAFVAWVIDVNKHLPEELPKIIKAIGDWVSKASSDVKDSSVPVGQQMILGIIEGLGGLKDALLKVAGDSFAAFRTEFMKSLGGGGSALANGGQKGGGDTIPQLVGGMLTQMGLTASQINAFCGPLAAEAIQRGLTGVGENIPTLLQDALKAGWTASMGMGGTGNFQGLLSKLGIPSVIGSLSEATKALAAGIPVAISTGAHYYVAQGLDELGKFIVGESGKAVGQATHLTLDEIDKRSKEITQRTLGVAVGVQDFVIPTLQGLQKGTGEFGHALLQMGDAADAGMTQLGQNLSSNTDALRNYIAQAAMLRGIDPATALQVAAGETANFTKFIGDLNSSFGPFQLHLGNIAHGPNSVAGLGDEFKKLTGLDVTSVTTWPEQIDYALDYAATHGWAAWHAAAASGIGDFQGIGTAAAASSPALQSMVDAVDDAGDSVAVLAGSGELWQQIQANATETGRTFQQFLGDTAAPGINLATASLAQLQAMSGLTLPQIQVLAGAAGEDVRHWLLDVGVPAADALRTKFADTSLAAADLGAKTDGLEQPTKDAGTAFTDLGSKLGEVAANQATQIAAVLLQLRDGLLGEGDYAGKGLIKAVNDFIAVLNKIPRDITVTIHTVGSVPSSAGGGGGGGGSSSKSSSSDSAMGNVDLGRAETDQGYRDQLRDNYNVGRDDNGKLYVEPKARGGRVQGGSPYLVGEQGSELFTPSGSGSITPHSGLIDYDRLGDAVARALLGVSLSVDVDQIHSAFLQKKRRNGTLGLS